MGLKIGLSYNSQVLLHVLRKDPSVIKNGYAYLKNNGTYKNGGLLLILTNEGSLLSYTYTHQC